MTEYPDTRLGPLGPADKRFPMPGLVAPSEAVMAKSGNLVTGTQSKEMPDILTAPLPQERQAAMLHQFLAAPAEVFYEIHIYDH